MAEDDRPELGADFYSQIANMFPCVIEGDVRADGRQPAREELRQRIEHAFRAQLSRAGFAFRGPAERSYVAYRPDKPAKVCPSGLYVAFRGFEFRFLGVDGGLYLVVDPHVVMNSTVTVQSLLGRGLAPGDLQGFHVLLASSSGTATAYLVGTLRSEMGGICTCRTADGDTLTVDAADVLPEPRPELLTEFAKKLGVPCDAVSAHRELSFLSSKKPSLDRLDRTVGMVRYLAREEIAVFPLPVGSALVQVTPTPVPVRGSGFLAGDLLPEARLSFDMDDATAVATNTFAGLKRFGPYEKGARDIRVALLAPAPRLDDLRKLLSTLIRGSEHMPGGMEHFVWCKLLLAHEEVVKDEQTQSYREASERLLTRQRNSADIDLVLVFVPKTSEWRFDTPYYACKSVLTGGGLACQMVTSACVANLSWSVANIASAIYAKCRGVPWALADTRSPFDAVVGVAVSQSLGMNRPGAAQGRFMGYANVFDEWGRWLFFHGTTARAQPGQTAQQLEAIVGAVVAQFTTHRGIAPGCIAIHYWKRFSRDERSRVIAMLRSAAGADVRVCFISINDDHPYRLYDKNVADGAFPRGGYALLHPHRFFLCTTGDTPLSKKRIGTPRLLDITFDCSPEDFVAAEDVARHILGLTKLNYATLTPLIREPVTLLFAHQIAVLAAAMTEQEWNGVSQPGTPVATKRRMFFL